jgi:small GTP-binding protein
MKLNPKDYSEELKIWMINSVMSEKIKIVLVGRQGSGKTSLCSRYVYGYHLEKESTVGIAFFHKMVTLNDRRLSLNIWDTAGSERYNTFTKTYLRGAHFCLVCFDMNAIGLQGIDLLEDIKRYIDMCLQQSEQTEIILVATKFEDDSLKDQYKEIDDFSSNHGHKLVYTSSLTGKGIDDLFTYISSKCLLFPPPIKLQQTINLTSTKSDSSCCF